MRTIVIFASTLLCSYICLGMRSACNKVAYSAPATNKVECMQVSEPLVIAAGMEEENCISLVDFTDSDNEDRPERDMVYEHNEGSLRVLQVVNVDESDENSGWPYVLVYENLMDVAVHEGLVLGIINNRDYVTGEQIVKGEYRYIGTHTYETSRIEDGIERKGTNTIRMFVEVGCKYDKTAQDDSDAAAKKKSNNKKHPKIKPPVKLPPGKGTSRDKPLSQAEIVKALASGARFGASNQLAANEEQRCISLISRRFYECWTDFEWSENLRPVHLMVRFGSGGKILGYRIIQSSGNEKMDMSVLAAAKRAGYVAGLSSEFLKRYPEVTIEMKPKR